MVSSFRPHRLNYCSLITRAPDDFPLFRPLFIALFGFHGLVRIARLSESLLKCTDAGTVGPLRTDLFRGPPLAPLFKSPWIPAAHLLLARPLATQTHYAIFDVPPHRGNTIVIANCEHAHDSSQPAATLAAFKSSRFAETQSFLVLRVSKENDSRMIF